MTEAQLRRTVSNLTVGLAPEGLRKTEALEPQVSGRGEEQQGREAAVWCTNHTLILVTVCLRGSRRQGRGAAGGWVWGGGGREAAVVVRGGEREGCGGEQEARGRAGPVVTGSIVTWRLLCSRAKAVVTRNMTVRSISRVPLTALQRWLCPFVTCAQGPRQRAAAIVLLLLPTHLLSLRCLQEFLIRGLVGFDSEQGLVLGDAVRVGQRMRFMVRGGARLCTFAVCRRLRQRVSGWRD